MAGDSRLPIERVLQRSIASETGCVNWPGTTNHSGYGVVKSNGKNLFVHRVSYAHHNGEIPDGKCVCHTCDNRRCVNPEHLFLGTRAENNSDKTEKGRQSRGRNHGIRVRDCRKNKLSKTLVVEIKKLNNTGKTQRELAVMFGVSQTTISNVVNERIWV